VKTHKHVVCLDSLKHRTHTDIHTPLFDPSKIPIANASTKARTSPNNFIFVGNQIACDCRALIRSWCVFFIPERGWNKKEERQDIWNNKTNKCMYTSSSFNISLAPFQAEMSLFVLFNLLQIYLRDFSSRKTTHLPKKTSSIGHQQIFLVKKGQTMRYCLSILMSVSSRH
jgi:hypothetical protein